MIALISMIISTLYLEQIFLSKPAVLLILSCQFIPQIVRNTLNGYRHVPDLSYPIGFFIFNLYFPLYIYCFDNNIFFLRADSRFALVILLTVFLQIYALKI